MDELDWSERPVLEALAETCKLFCTFTTPLVFLAIRSTSCFCCSSRTLPESVTVPLLAFT
jgi:hypothetical protein